MRTASICVVAACGLLSALVAYGHAETESDRARRLVGTWTIRNETADATYSRRKATGQVTFSGDQMTIDSGAFAAGGIVAGSESGYCLIPLQPISFRILGTGSKQVLYLSWMGQQRKNGEQLVAQDAVINFIKFNRDEATLIGSGGCGSVAPARISYLTRVR